MVDQLTSDRQRLVVDEDSRWSIAAPLSLRMV
jgi:hypothetical protein